MLKPDRLPLLEACGLTKHYEVKRSVFAKASVKAVDGVDLRILPGESFGIVGESGSGKSTLARLILRLTPATAGRVIFDGEDITQLCGAPLRQLRRSMQIVFQNPHSALNGRHTIFDAIGEPLRVQEGLRGAALKRQVDRLMDMVSLPGSFAFRYPHELSGGQKQRVCIARAVALKPRLLVLDEPTSALDVSVQAQILACLSELQRELSLTYLFISHNLAVVEHISHRVAVMYLGRIVEYTDKVTLFKRPLHPYTEALLNAVPVPDPEVKRDKRVVQGDVPSPLNPPPGCHFHTRCAYAEPRCKSEAPLLREVEAGHQVACHLR